MAKKRTNNALLIELENFDKKHFGRLNKYSDEILELMQEYASEAVALGYGKPLPAGTLFSFDANKRTKAKAEKLFAKMASDLENSIKAGVVSEWAEANGKHNHLIDSMLTGGRLNKDQVNRFKPVNSNALDAFLKRSSDGLKLSDRVWNIANRFQTEIETSISAGLISGQSAQSLAREVRKNLKEPERIFRRVKDEDGFLRLSQQAQQYKPGRGVYRSSVKNAQRLTRTEINIAYRTADGLRWHGSELVKGVKIALSPQHPRPDICDKLKGNYPKDFKFSGWHPQCICTATPILISDEELDALELAEMNNIEFKPSNVVNEIPVGLSDWIKENAERAKKWKNMPYFIRDNFSNGKINGKYTGGFN